MKKFENFLRDFKRRFHGPFFEEEIATIEGDHILVVDMIPEIDYEYYGGLDEGIVKEMEIQYADDFCLRHFLQINRYMENVSKKNEKTIDFIYFSKCNYYFYFDGLRKEIKTYPYRKDEYEFPTKNSMIWKSVIPPYRDTNFFEIMAAAYNYELETGNEVKSISFVKEIEMDV